MKVSELFRSVNPAEVIVRLTELYHGEDKNIRGYKEALCEIYELGESPSTQAPDMHVWINLYPPESYDPPDTEKYIDVGGRSCSDKDQTIAWAIEFQPWEEWLGMEIVVEKAAAESGICSTPLDIAAHILFEMTFHGYSQKDVKEVRDDLFELAEEAKKQIPENE